MHDAAGRFLLSYREPAVADSLIIFDTTLRDGEQSPGASMTRDEKLRIARQLERLRVDVIAAGFAASSNGDFEAVRAIAAAIRANVANSGFVSWTAMSARAVEEMAQTPAARPSTPSIASTVFVTTNTQSTVPAIEVAKLNECQFRYGL